MIPYGRQLIEADDEAAVLAVLRSDFLTQGPVVEAFEAALAARVGARFCLAVSSATTGLQLAMAALDLGSGEAITTPNTFVATANAMLHTGLTPVFADIEADSFNLSPDATRAAITPDTCLVVPVHFAGRPADMEAFGALARAHGLKVIEDAAHAIGSTYADGGAVGNCAWSDATVFSFHPVKTITTGEGGAVTTNDPDLYARMLALRSHGLERDPARLSAAPAGPWVYEQQSLGFNFRMTEMQAALGLSQLAKLDRFAARRTSIIDRYQAGLSGLAWLELPLHTPDQALCHHLFVARMDFEAIRQSRAEVMASLRAQGVGSQVHYIPVHTQPLHRARSRIAPGGCANAEAYYDRCLSLPLYPAMTDADVDQVIRVVRGLHS
jgi:UDP-4-amino-4,6-dideoxy-N-acetyl-beta-L-altrosamine transaminase